MPGADPLHVAIVGPLVQPVVLAGRVHIRDQLVEVDWPPSAPIPPKTDPLVAGSRDQSKPVAQVAIGGLEVADDIVLRGHHLAALVHPPQHHRRPISELVALPVLAAGLAVHAVMTIWENVLFPGHQHRLRQR